MTDRMKTTRGKRRKNVEARKRHQLPSLPRIIPGVRREIPTYELASEEGLDLIEKRSSSILKEIGVEFRGDPKALELWRSAVQMSKGSVYGSMTV